MRWFSNLKLSRKLMLGTVLKVGPFLLVCALLLSAMADVGHRTDRLYRNDMAVISATRDVRYSLSVIGRALAQQHLAPKAERASARPVVEAQRLKLRSALEALGPLEFDEGARRDVEAFRAKLEPWSARVAKVMDANEADRLAEALLALGEVKGLQAEFEPLIDRALTSANASAARRHQEVVVAVERSRLALILGVVLSVLISLLVVWRVSAAVTAPIHELHRKLEAVGEGDFTQRIAAQSTDEVGQVAAALNATLEKVSRALAQVRTVSGQVTSAAAELHQSATEISAGAAEQAAGFEETAASLEEITSTVRTTSENAQQATTLTQDSRGAAESGQQVVDNAISAMTELSKSSRQIADIITTIDEIAFQTNLLALNAAVEAARAGDQGRGFAVVANEVRNLAQRSATSAKEIKQLIQGSLSRVDSGVTLVNQSGDALRGIVSSVARVSGLVGDIATASKEQSMGVDQVNKAVVQMDQVTQRNAAQTQELTATADRLSTSARHLEATVARFKLGEGGATVEAAQPQRAATFLRPKGAPAPTRATPSAVRAAPDSPAFTELPPAPFPTHGEAPDGFQEF
jgi:methyl-accepting chemotaxis protein